ncbi:hypothetical protein SDC9_209019 [bioreactor metagenome]|uniref:Uncharacterized protein n=1 Tax=bioreactor metagenome TaxID=1076179 RepID=A0A645JLU0_9ZZZZ
MSCGKFPGCLVLILGAADHRQHLAGLKGFLLQAQVLHNILDDPLAVIGVVDGKVLFKSQPVDVPPQNPDAGRVKGGGPDVLCGGSQSGREPLL